VDVDSEVGGDIALDIERKFGVYMVL